MPVFAVVSGDVGAVGTYGDPEFLGGVVGYGGAVAAGWGDGCFQSVGCFTSHLDRCVCSGACALIRLLIVPADNDKRTISVLVWIATCACSERKSSRRGSFSERDHRCHE